MRSIVFRYPDLTEFALALGDEPREMELPAGETGTDGEWVLAIFEVGKKRRSTATATRIVDRAGARFVTFEARDWERLYTFATARNESMRPMRVTRPPLPPENAAAHGEPELRIAPPPVSSGPLSESPPSSRAFSLGTVTNAKVLVVDDDAPTRRMVVEVMSAAGLSAASVGSAEQALPLLRSDPVDLMILDVELPMMSGLELVRQIRQDGDLKTLPILLVSGHTSSKDIVAAFASGADDFVVKPFRAPELAARIFSLLLHVQRTRGRTSVPPAATT